VFAVVSPRSVTPTPTEVPGGSGPVTMVPGGCTRSCEGTAVFQDVPRFRDFPGSSRVPRYNTVQGSPRFDSLRVARSESFKVQCSEITEFQGPRARSSLRFAGSKLPGFQVNRVL
jgi:hypothetical protein